MKKLLFILANIALVTQLSYAALTDNLSHYYKYDESSGNAADSVGSITFVNNGTLTYAAGKINNGATLVAASSQYFTPSSSYNVTAAFSIGFWIKLNSTGVAQYIFSSPTTGSSACIDISVQADNKIHYSNFVNEVTSTNTLSSGTWYYVVITSDGTNSVIYLNGASNGTSALVSHSASSQSYQVGRRADNASGYFDGMVDEMSIYDRQISGSEVTQLYNGGSGLQYPFSSGTPFTQYFGFFRFFGI